MVSRGLTEFLQIDLLQMHAVTAIRTQGRFGKGQGREYSEAYVIEYWRPGFIKWERWKNIQGKEVSLCTDHHHHYYRIDKLFHCVAKVLIGF